MTENFTVYSQQEYFDNLVEKVEHTNKGDRIAVATMGFEVHDSNTTALLHSMGNAAERGVTTTLIIDAFAQIFDKNCKPTGMIPDRFKSAKASAYFAEKTHRLASLSSQGVSVSLTNTPLKVHIPYAGRSHIKGAVVNNDWQIGGCNLSDTDNLDAMIGGTQESTAEFIYSIFHKMAETGNMREALGDTNIVWKIDESTDLLIDVGVPGKSVIYNRAVKAIDTAKDWVTLTCQFFPSGTTAYRLAKTIPRGVDSYVFFNNSIQNRLGSSAMNAITALSRATFPKQLFRGELEEDMPYLHAKILATEKEAILGSHNFINAGVLIGTAEVALHTKDPKTVRQIGLMAHKLASKNNDPEFLFIND